MNEYDIAEQSYKNGYTNGFRDGLNIIEKWIKEHPIQEVLEALSNKEIFFKKELNYD